MKNDILSQWFSNLCPIGSTFGGKFKSDPNSLEDIPFQANKSLYVQEITNTLDSLTARVF